MTSPSRLFEMLAADHRREVLFMLCGTESFDVPDGLFRRGAARAQRSEAGPVRGSGVEDGAPADQPPQRLDIEFQHCHLPKLEAEGLIEWDREAGTVSRGPAFQEIEPALRVLASNSVAFPGDLF
jgi:hypothetical protein